MPMSQVPKSPNTLEARRKMVYETIAQKISTNVSNPTTATLNDEEIDTHQDQQTEHISVSVFEDMKPHQNNQYMIELNKAEK